MLALLAALHLLALAQGPGTEASPPPPAEETPPQTAPETAPPAENPPLPRKPGAGEAPAAEPPPRASPAQETPPPSAIAPAKIAPPPARPKLLSLLSAESLGGGSLLFAQAGWSSLGIQYGQGITREEDLVALLDFDWAKTELRLGGFYRKPLGAAEVWDVAARFGLAWYANYGGRWIYSENESDRGVELAPALLVSRRAAGGVFSAAGEAPLVITVRRGAGVLFSPRLTVSYEAPLLEEITVGAKAGVGYRAGGGGAPLKDGRGEVVFLVVGSYRL
jgi:hypothetical protein